MEAQAQSRAADHLIRAHDVNPGWLVLYGATWALQWFSAPFRYFLASGVLLLINWIMSWHLPVHSLALLVGFGPLVISLGTLVLPLGGWWFEQSQGGRRPSEREQLVFDGAIAELQRVWPELRPPHRWFVTDEAEPNACAYADTLMVTKGMLYNPAFPAVLAHEMGHLNSSDARLSAALYRITTPPREPVGFPFKLLSYLISGRIGLAPVKKAWAMYWRHRETIADEYAVRLGQGPQLAAYLDSNALEGDLPTPFKDFGESSHPWTEHRIELLEAYGPVE